MDAQPSSGVNFLCSTPRTAWCAARRAQLDGNFDAGVTAVTLLTSIRMGQIQTVGLLMSLHNTTRRRLSSSLEGVTEREESARGVHALHNIGRARNLLLDRVGPTTILGSYTGPKDRLGRRQVRDTAGEQVRPAEGYSQRTDAARTKAAGV